MTNFDILHNCWIPVRTRAGHPETLGIFETLERAHELRGIEDASPLVVASLQRLLLAFLYRAFKPTGTSRVLAMLEAGKFDSAILNKYFQGIPPSRFDLFGDTPFYQVGNLEFERDTSIAKLAVERSSGNNKALFDHSVDEKPPSLNFAEAARWLVAHQAFSLCGGISAGGLMNFTDAPSPRGALVFVTGRNLHETLCGNLVPYREGLELTDHAIWEVPAITYESLKPKQTRALNKFEFAKLFTWQSRAIRLLANEQNVDRVFYASGWQGVGVWRDPMCAYSISKKADKEDSVVRFSLEKAFWRDFDTLVPPDAKLRPQVLLLDEALRHDLENNGALQITLLGQVARPGKPVVDAWRAEQYPLPLQLLDDETRREKIDYATKRAEEIGSKVVRGAGYVLALNLTDTEAAGDLLESLPLLREYWGNLETKFRMFIIKLGSSESPDTALDWWSDQVLLTLKAAMKTTRKALGFRAIEIKAFLEAESKLNLELHKLNLLERYKKLGQEVKV